MVDTMLDTVSPATAARPGRPAPTTGSLRGRSWLSHFSRLTTSGRYVPEVDGLRLVAIVAVIVFHLAINLEARNPVAYAVPTGPLRAVLTSGELGVQLFFVVSGLVLALPFARHHLLDGPPVSLRAYALRRLARLEPPYVVAMLGCFGLLLVTGGSAAVLTPHLLASLAYLHVPVYGHDSVVNNVAWSLEVEIQFYVLVPWLTAVFAIRNTRVRRAVLVAAVLVTSALGLLVAGLSPHLHKLVLRFAQYFLVGFLLAELLVLGRLRPLERRGVQPRPAGNAVAWDAAALATVPLVVMLHTGTGLARLLPGSVHQLVAEVGIPWLVLLAYGGVFRGVVLNRALTQPVVTTVGGMCYSIYLLHNVFGQHLTSLTARWAPFDRYAADLALQVAVVLPATVLVSAVFFLLVERPCMDPRWPQRLAAWALRRRGAAAAPRPARRR